MPFPKVAPKPANLNQTLITIAFSIDDYNQKNANLRIICVKDIPVGPLVEYLESIGYKISTQENVLTITNLDEAEGPKSCYVSLVSDISKFNGGLSHIQDLMDLLQDKSHPEYAHYLESICIDSIQTTVMSGSTSYLIEV